jgi:hypothetical protein
MCENSDGVISGFGPRSPKVFTEVSKERNFSIFRVEVSRSETPLSNTWKVVDWTYGLREPQTTRHEGEHIWQDLHVLVLAMEGLLYDEWSIPKINLNLKQKF